MTRINVVPVEELHTKHLVAEAHEITRVFGLARKAQHSLHKRKIPSHYTLNRGHVLFFYNRLGFVADRYEQLTNEMQRRGYSPNPIAREELLKGIDSRLVLGYNPTPEALEINRQRIKERLTSMSETRTKK